MEQIVSIIHTNSPIRQLNIKIEGSFKTLKVFFVDE